MASINSINVLLVIGCTFLFNTEAKTLPRSGHTRAEVDALKACLLQDGILENTVILRDDPEDATVYEELNYQWNLLHGIYTPLVYLEAETESDISIAVRCAIQTGIRIVPRSGGHSYVKYGFGDSDSFIVDLQHMNEVQVFTEPETGNAVATVAAGIRGGKLQYELWAAGEYLIPTGLCPMVGVQGYTLGGGFGVYSRQHGLAIDSLLEVRMVDATGEVIVANAEDEENADLFWALRGGGGGNFGIVTSLKYQIHPVPRQVGLAIAEFKLEDLVPFFKAVQAFASAESPDVPADHLGIHTGINFHGEKPVIVLYAWSMRDDEGLATAEVWEMLAKWFPPPASVEITPFNYPEFVLELAQGYVNYPLTNLSQMVNITKYNVVHKKVKSMYVEHVIESEEVFQQLKEQINDYMQWPGAEIVIEMYGAAINRPDTKSTAFSHREGVLYDMQLAMYNEAPEAIEALRRFYESTKTTLRHTQSYQNYLDEDIPDYLERYYGPNLPRLVEVKQRIDPNNVFHHPQSIPVSL